MIELTEREAESLRRILRGVHLADWGSAIVSDAHTILRKLKADKK